MEIDYNAVFGVDAGANEPEVAEPVETNVETEGAKEQETAEPAEANETNTDNHVDEGEEQTPEMRAKFAAIRRKAEAERDAAIAKMKADLEAENKRAMDEMYAKSGFINPYTKKPIANKEEYDAYLDQHAVERKQIIMRKTGMTESDYDEFLSSLPEVRAAREAKQQAEAAEQTARDAAAKAKIDEQIKEISGYDPNIKSVEDLSKMPNYKQFYEFVKRGNTFVDAYKLANMDTLLQDAANASRQRAVNAASSKQHLATTQSRGQGAVPVPEDIKEQYRMFNPNATDAEIQNHYNKQLKK